MRIFAAPSEQRPQVPLPPVRRLQLSTGFITAALALTAFSLFIRSATNFAAYDDLLIFYGNPYVQHLHYWRQLFMQDYWRPVAHGGLYRPLTLLSFNLLWHLRPRDPFCQHVANLLLYAAITALLYLWLRRLLPERAAVAGALWFAATPLHVEVAATIVGREDLLATFFFLVVLVLFTYGREWRSGWQALALLAIMLASLGALLSKESAIVLLPMLLVLCAVNYCQGAVRPGRFELTACALSLLATLLYLAARLAVVGLLTHKPAFYSNPLAYQPAGWRMLSALAVSGVALKALLWPVRLPPDYSFNQIPMVTHWSDWRPWLVLLVLSVFALLCYRGRHQPALLIGAALLFGAYAPVSNLLFPIGTIFGNRLLFLPSLGFALLVAFAFSRLPVIPRRLVAVLALLGLVFLARLDWHECDYWNDNALLFPMAAQRAPNSAVAQAYCGIALIDSGHMHTALAHYQRALSIAPAYPLALEGKGEILLVLGQTNSARPLLRQALLLQPSPNFLHEDVLAEARGGDPAFAWRQLPRVQPLPAGFLSWMKLVLTNPRKPLPPPPPGLRHGTGAHVK